MKKFIRKAPGKEKCILRVPETGRDLLDAGQVVEWGPYWLLREQAGLIISGRESSKKKPDIIPEDFNIGENKGGEDSLQDPSKKVKKSKKIKFNKE